MTNIVARLGLGLMLVAARLAWTTTATTTPTNLTTLLQEIVHMQEHQTREFSKPNNWATIEGLFKTEVHISFSGPAEVTSLRGVGVPALEVRPSLLVLHCLLEAQTLGLPPPPTPALNAALQALESFHSKNFPPGSSVLTCCPESFDKKLKVWRPSAVNPGEAPNLTTPLTLLDSLVSNHSKPAEDLRQRVAQSRPLEVALNTSVAEWIHWTLPDAADSYANLAVGAMLKAQDSLVNFFHLWQYVNSKLLPLLQRTEDLAYRPFSEDKGRNSIDARSYYWLRPFLEKVAPDDRENVAIVTSWLSKTTQAGLLHYNSQPLYPNSVDLFTCASFLHGITAAALSNLVSLSDNMQALYHWTGELLAWALSESLGERPDLALGTSPSRYLLYWMAARTLCLLTSASNETDEVFLETRDSLREVLQKNITADILNRMLDGGIGDDGKAVVFVDDVVGVNDVDSKGKVTPSGADRLFSSALAANTLLTVWTQKGDKDVLRYSKDTDHTVKLGVQRLTNYVYANLQTQGASLENAVFARLTRNNKTLQCAFPATDVMSGDKKVNATEWAPDLVSLVSGFVSPDDYSELEGALCGHVGGNDTASAASTDSVFPYWSSPAVTKAACLLALARYQMLDSKDRDISR